MDDRRPDYKYGQMQRPYQQPQPMTYAHPQPLPGAVPASVLDQTQKMTSTASSPCLRRSVRKRPGSPWKQASPLTATRWCEGNFSHTASIPR